MTSAPAMTPQQQRFSDPTRSGLALYRELVVGDGSWFEFGMYEATQLLLSGLPGVVGLGLRAAIYPKLLGKCGRRPAFGRSVVLRRPSAITLGEGVVVDDFAVLDVRGANGSIKLGDRVSIGRFTTIAAKGGDLQLADGVNIGSYCRVATQSRIAIGSSTLIAAYCYIGPGNHQITADTKPLIESEMENRGGVVIGDHCWIGAHTTIMDGVIIGAGAIVGAHSLVRENVPAAAVVAGVPARIIRTAPLSVITI